MDAQSNQDIRVRLAAAEARLTHLEQKMREKDALIAALLQKLQGLGM